MRLVLSIAFLVAGGSLAQSQTSNSKTNSGTTGTLSGLVSDSLRHPLQSVEVTIVGIGRSARTDSAGEFVFRDLPFGSYRVEAKRIGYQPHAHAATVSDVRGSRIVFVLSAAPQVLDPQNILGQLNILPPGAPQRLFDFYRRRKTATGTYITRDQIERTGSVRATLAPVSGIRLFTAPGGQVRGMKFIRCSGSIRGDPSPVAYFLDGLQTNEGVFSFLSDNDIEALEIYKGAASMPPEAVGNACAAVFIWTRR